MPESNKVTADLANEITPDLADAFRESFGTIEEIVHANAIAHGFWSLDRNFGEAVALIHSELSEALEAHRAGNPDDEKVPAFSSVEVEFADVIIRIMDIAYGYNLDVKNALMHKVVYNTTREMKHGKKY